MPTTRMVSGIDGENTNSLIEDNIVEDHPGQGIFYEVSGSGTIRNNTIRRNGTSGTDSGIFISTSKNVDIYGNTLTDNWRGIQYFVDCTRVGQGGVVGVVFDLANNTAHDNTITFVAGAGQYASMLNSVSCTAAQFAPYTDGTKQLVFQANAYSVPSLTTKYWYWAGATKSWAEWQALGHDTTGTVRLVGSPSLLTADRLIYDSSITLGTTPYPSGGDPQVWAGDGVPDGRHHPPADDWEL